MTNKQFALTLIVLSFLSISIGYILFFRLTTKIADANTIHKCLADAFAAPEYSNYDGYYFDPNTKKCSFSEDLNGNRFATIDECKKTCGQLRFTSYGHEIYSIKNNIYFRGTYVGVADAKTFTILNPQYFKDKFNIYNLDINDKTADYDFILQKIDGADPKTFQIMTGILFAKDKNRIYYDGSIVKGVDADSFEIINSKYAKDSKNVYYLPKEFTLISTPSSVTSVTLDILTDADPSTFKIITDRTLYSENMIAKDKNKVYFDNIVMEGANPNTFEIIDDKISDHFDKLSKDNNYVYYNSEKIEGADSASFEKIDKLFFKDKNNLYILTSLAYNKYFIKKIEDIDIGTFQILDNTFLKDKNYVYQKIKSSFENYDFIKLEGIDPATFNINFAIYNNAKVRFTKDKNGVYSHTNFYTTPSKIIYNKVVGADPATFKILFYGKTPTRYAADIDSVFVVKDKNSDNEATVEIVEGVTPTSFEVPSPF